MKIKLIKIEYTTIDVLDDIIEKIGSLAISDVRKHGDTEFCDIKLDPQLVKIAVDSEALHILRFELCETRHCVIDCFRFGRIKIV
jgi:hypothetical protein